MKEDINSEDLGQELIDAGFGIDVESMEIEQLTSDDTLIRIFSISDNVERERYISKLRNRAKKLDGGIRNFNNVLKAFQQSYIQEKKRTGAKIIKVTDCPLENLKCNNWIVDDSGVYQYKLLNYEQIKVVACSHPILPVERLINIDTNTEKVKLAFYKDNKWQYIVVDRSVVANKSKIVVLADRGIEVTSENAKDLVNYISEMVSLNIDKIPCYKGVNRLGWTNDGFSPYQDDLKYDGDIENKTAFESVKEKGNFEEWKKHCIELRNNSKIAQILLATSFASPLIKILGMNCYCVHLWGGTGTGKTVGLMLAMSVWGNPSVGKLISSTNCTKVFLERTSGFHHDIPVALDELQIIKNKFVNYDELIMMLTEGVNRGRGKAAGGTEDKIEWNCNFIFTGEEPITQQNSGGGVKNRVLEIETIEKVIEDGNYTANLLRENYGFAGKLFIENLPNKEEIRKQHKELQKEILEKFDTTEKQAIPIASILIADKLSTDLIFKDKNFLTIDDFKNYLSSTKEVDVSERAYEWLNDWIYQNINRFKEDTNTDFYGIIEEEKNTCWILRKVFEDALESNNFSSKVIIKKFAEKGYIEKDNQDKFTCQKKCNGINRRFIKLYLKNNEVDKNNDIPF